MQGLEKAKQALIGRRLNPQKAKAPPYFEGWYTRVIGPTHSFGIVTVYFPEQSPEHSAAYTALVVNDDSACRQLQTFESYLPPGRQPVLIIERGDTEGEQQTAFLFKHPGGVINIQGSGPDLVYEAHVAGASARFRSLSSSTAWSDDGGGSPMDLLHLLPGLGLHWYVHSTLTRVAYEVTLPGGAGSWSGEGWAHVEKNWGGSFPRSFIWSQGFASSVVARSGEGPQGTRSHFAGDTDSDSTRGQQNGSSGVGSSGAETDKQANNGKQGSSTAQQQPVTGGKDQPQATFCLAGGVLPTLNLDKLPVPLPDVVLLGYRSAKLNWHYKPHSPALFSTTIHPEQGLLLIKASQLTRSITLRVQAPLETFARVGGPTRAGFVPHSVESYSATATAECYENGQLVEVAHFDRSALEFGGSYACRAEEAAGRSTEGLVCKPQWEG